MHSQDYQQLPNNTDTPMQARIIPKVHWTVKERQSGVWTVVREFDNLVTNYGLTALASAPAGTYTPPIYLVIETSVTTMAAALAGAGSVSLVADPTIGGDTQLVLGVGLASQETVTFSSKTGTGPFIFTLVGTLANNHLVTDQCARAPIATDTMTSVLAEAQYDSFGDPNGRVTMAASYSPATAQGTMQFFMTGSTATNLYFSLIGLTDQKSMTSLSANLHNYAPLGYNHNNVNDIEIDVNYTLQTF